MTPKHDELFSSIETIRKGFEVAGYICSQKIATTLYLAYHLGKPILVEGAAGVGKTELGKVTASYLGIPLTSNNTREMSEALKRRCLHLFIPFPNPKLEREIIRVHVPDLSVELRVQLVSFIQQVRKLDLKKTPSISETIDWARVLLLLHSASLNPDLIRETLNTFLKFEEDIEIVLEHLYGMTKKAGAEGRV